MGAHEEMKPGTAESAEHPEGVFSLLDTDLYKLTMQCCILKYFPQTNVTFNFTNRTPDFKFSRESVVWLQDQIAKLENVYVSEEEFAYLKSECKYLTEDYLEYLKDFRLRPHEQVELVFTPENDRGFEADIGSIVIHVKGLWVETILYEIPLLALVSEAYFKFRDRAWTHEGQLENAQSKGEQLLQAGCTFSEFGSRRRRDYHTQELVVKGLKEAAEKGKKEGWSGKLSGTSNVHFAMRFGLPPVGTVAHEWFMGVAAITDDYEHANETALRYWVDTFGVGVLGIALTDTFGTKDFLKAFKKPIGPGDSRTFAEVFVGVRQDSGDPVEYAKLIRKFYDEQNIQTKQIVYSDSLDVEKCLKCKEETEKLNLSAAFGVGTFLTNDFKNIMTGEKSVPLNIVIKIASAEGRPAVKLSDNLGKNTGDKATVDAVKRKLGYVEAEWKDGDEAHRWG